MTGLILIVVTAAGLGLWLRMRQLEERLAKLEEQGDARFRMLLSGAQRAPEADPVDAAPGPGEDPVLPADEPLAPAPSEQLTRPAAFDPPDTSESAISAPVEQPRPDFDTDFDTELDAGIEEADEAAPRSAYKAPEFDFEEIFGRRLPIWAGGIALAVAGIFLVLYSIENGLVTEPVRVALSFVFGIGLLGAAEAAHRMAHRVSDPRVGQALAGAGLATLYAAFYLAGARYGLIGPAASFAGLALVTGLAVGLTFRFGLPAAILGLLGGFATPLLVASDDANVPVLAFYLALLTAALALTGRRTGMRWLGFAAIFTGFGWGAVMLAAGPVMRGDMLAIGLYIVALGAIIPAALPFEGKWLWPRLVTAALGALQLAILVASAGYDLLTWGLYFLLAAGLAALGWKLEQLRAGSAIAAATALMLLLIWPDPVATHFAIVGAGGALVFLTVPLALIWQDRARQLDIAQLCVGAVLLAMAGWAQFGPDGDFEPYARLGLMTAALAAFPALAAWRMWDRTSATKIIDAPIAGTGVLAAMAGYLLLPEWAKPFAPALVGVGLALVAARRQDGNAAIFGWVAALAGLMVLLGTDFRLEETARLFGVVRFGMDEGAASLLLAMLRWMMTALPFAALALWDRAGKRRFAAELFLAATLYGVIAQIAPPEVLPLLTALGAMAAIHWLAGRRGLWLGAMAIAGLWTVGPIFTWLGTGGEAALGMAMFVTDLPALTDTLQRLLPFAAAGAFVAARQAGKRRAIWSIAFAAAAVIIAAHVLFKQLFAIGTLEQFVQYGLAERTAWQALLVIGGLGLARLVSARLGKADGLRWAGYGLAAAGMAHFAWFSMVLHNPLWDAQATGALPVLNLLLVSYGIAGLGVHFLAAGKDGGEDRRVALARRVAAMVLICAYALSELRHAFSGSILTAQPMGQTEDLLRSLLGIVLALGFLAWGSRTDQRSWRIGSLVLMLLAVAKVFLVDAAGLEGLLRIASFLALGFSLIGIGWVYSRQLKSRTPDADNTAT
ncbi:DUF2339 domain-containing protein [Paraurantiacibacter namhicola]|uniref:DUF2339 domain-containing protein n=1 Tax=Paraurantiacibacter namhicola TaxID=645517 RepID=A0A1C7D6J8_9SPHN|nr:DUF2339 domain-containing protein [Paraurantiacibacter namhicola]ANU07084.1 hypothetical protein A6F65_00764 [Paraurantiacibacter namhicola]